MNNELIIILDLDGTIIGNCYYQSEIYIPVQMLIKE